MIRKIANSGTAVTTTDYLDGFVYVNSVLSYFNMPEGRVTNNSGALTPEYIMTDQQGNARISFNGIGTGAKVIQENSYYGFGMVMPGSVVATPPAPNKDLYNGGSEWQNDFSILPDLMQTFYRNYDAALGRWTGVDPQAEGAESMSTYQYTGNNPIMGNDPMGNLMKPVNGGGPVDGGDANAFIAEGIAEGQAYTDAFNAWADGSAGGGAGGTVVNGFVFGSPPPATPPANTTNLYSR